MDRLLFLVHDHDTYWDLSTGYELSVDGNYHRHQMVGYDGGFEYTDWEPNDSLKDHFHKTIYGPTGVEIIPEKKEFIYV